jgi:hypothetical protein
MAVKDTIQEIIGSINLMNLSSSRNNNLSRSKDTHRNSLALSLTLSRALIGGYWSLLGPLADYRSDPT